MDTRLLELLVCPVTKGPLEYDRAKQELISRSARLAYRCAMAFRFYWKTKHARSVTKNSAFKRHLCVTPC